MSGDRPTIEPEARQEDAERGILCDLAVDSPVLAVAFGGMMMQLDGIPPFEFFRILGGVAPVKKAFLRDHRQAYYHRGVRGFADDLAGVEVGLRGLIEDAGPSKVVMMGGSVGGYAALLFGRVLGVSEVHAFAPTTFLRADLRERYGDRRYEWRWQALMRSGRYQPRYGDLRELFRGMSPTDTRCVIHYCSTYALDVAHAEWLAGESLVELRGYEEGDHRLVRHLRDSGELEAILRDALAA